MGTYRPLKTGEDERVYVYLPHATIRNRNVSSIFADAKYLP